MTKYPLVHKQDTETQQSLQEMAQLGNYHEEFPTSTINF